MMTVIDFVSKVNLTVHEFIISHINKNQLLLLITLLRNHIANIIQAWVNFKVETHVENL